MSNEFLGRVLKAESLPSLPTVAMEVLRISRDENASADDLAAAIQHDPALTGKVLKMVNSSMFGVARKVGSVKQAVSLLGLRTVKVMALSFSLVDTVKGCQGGGFNFEAFWRRSLSTAVAARLLGKAALPQLAEDAFVAGLLSDLGMVAVWRAAPEKYEAVLKELAKRDQHVTVIEQRVLGMNHAAIGSALLKAWGLPEGVQTSVSAHHGDRLGELTGPVQQQARLVHCAASVADLFCQEIPPSELDRVREQCVRDLGIDKPKLEQILEALAMNVKDTASTLSLNVGHPIDYAQLQAEASMQMVQLSMQAEVERVEISKRADEARLEADRLNQEKQQILEVASTDSLTKVANRAAFDKRLDEELRRARERRHEVALIMLDVDHFKKFNDAHGHQAGDAVLRSVGQCLREVIRDAGFVARYGGEEFAVILAGMAETAVRSLAEKLRRSIESTPTLHHGARLHVTASLGAAMANVGSSTAPERMIRDADQRLYQAKRAGRNRIEMGEPAARPALAGARG
ncbi:Phytochrome-like protein cph2 [Phycisphaerae bacterium RAS1]|nr:Phytochrome-like protein cph2 [Phycisphaerae bacterium RAS1]